MQAARRHQQPARGRVVLSVAATVTLIAGLGLRLGWAGPVAKYGGVALWATLVFWLVVFVRPRLSSRRAGAIALAISWLVEIAQLTPGPAWLSSQHVVLRLVFGTTFHPPDLPAYALGVALAAVADGALFSAWRGMRRAPPGPRPVA